MGSAVLESRSADLVIDVDLDLVIDLVADYDYMFDSIWSFTWWGLYQPVPHGHAADKASSVRCESR